MSLLHKFTYTELFSEKRDLTKETPEQNSIKLGAVTYISVKERENISIKGRLFIPLFIRVIFLVS